ncbi:FliM/FliN family flagellar motor switch protein [Calycomorphotria hydatis]|uniref:Flagellar motor switch protein n=1 Tax=Calycomorphotria hydatis TaxID=2528027 RepID=A0A517T6K6_9PLAN|nr:FliM/FliN family flagellar motor switch protein [Calycomorphotria hydatis]QDT64006.1 flagellar motor switch protein [Calycomorphotria hydatis]
MADTELTTAQQVHQACAENAAALVESFNQCFDQAFELEVSEPQPWSPESIETLPEGAGVVVGVCFNDAGVMVLLPESILPGWYTTPDDSQKSRLQTLAMEWSMNLLPLEFEAGKFESKAVSSLQEAVADCGPAEDCLQFELILTQGGQTTPLKVLAPVGKAIPEVGFVAEDIPETAAQDSSPAEPSPPSQEQLAAMEQERDRQRRIARLSNMPVDVVVYLAEKRIELSQLLSLTPGTLITFNKSCEDLLNLYVNNHRYCRGEAVKIGEKFGLKINEVGVKESRETKVF